MGLWSDILLYVLGIASVICLHGRQQSYTLSYKRQFLRPNARIKLNAQPFQFRVAWSSLIV